MNEYSTRVVKNEFKLSMDSWIHYVYVNYYSWVLDSDIHKALV